MYRDDKKKEAHYKGILIGGMLAMVSIMGIKLFKKIKCKRIEKEIDELEADSKKQNEKEDIELKVKIDEFNSRRLTKENEDKN